MTKSIWKFPLKTTDRQVVKMPAGSEILTVQVQEGEPCIWALVEPEERDTYVVIRVYGTGHIIDDPAGKKYIGTYQVSGGALIFHVFRSSESAKSINL